MKRDRKSFDEYLTTVRSCSLCAEHLPLGPRPVVQASPNSKILVVGQAPGTKVHETGIPFNDPSGDRLREWMAVSREEFYSPELIALVPMGFCYPGKGKSGDLPPRKECEVTWRRDLLDKLVSVELTIVLGQYAQRYHLGDRAATNLTETVRIWRSYWPDIVALPHPSPRNNIWLRKNPWVEREIIPELQSLVKSILK